MKLIYVCSPYRGRIRRNIQNAKKYCGAISLLGDAPVAPHLLYSRFLDDDNPIERNIGMECALTLLEKCDEIYVFGGHTEGMKLEIEHAKKLNIPIKYYFQEAEDVEKN